MEEKTDIEHGEEKQVTTYYKKKRHKLTNPATNFHPRRVKKQAKGFRGFPSVLACFFYENV